MLNVVKNTLANAGNVHPQIAEHTASHTHSNTGTPTNAGAIRGSGQQADQLNGKYSPVIGK
ncbi:hypothetical protein FQ014_04250 [Escherichia coli]|nr:hypothetical protein [Escherichia coli]